jgi:hypothetical protein
MFDPIVILGVERSLNLITVADSGFMSGLLASESVEGRYITPSFPLDVHFQILGASLEKSSSDGHSLQRLILVGFLVLRPGPGDERSQLIIRQICQPRIGHGI